MNDQDLVREYVDRNSESAFAELVHRHINFVYSAAFRYAGNSPDAEDVTQAVFVILAKKAANLRRRATLTGWLYETTRFTAAALLRSRIRQRVREQNAYMQSTLNDPEPNGVWQQLAPILEQAMGRLNEKERALLALRLFDGKTAAETAALLGLREGAAHKRTARALEKLRRFFLQRGIHSSTALISETISANSMQAAPAALAKSVTALAIARGAAAPASTLTLIKGTTKIMAWSKVKTAVAAGITVLFAAGTITVVLRQIQNHRLPSGMSKIAAAPVSTMPPDLKSNLVLYFNFDSQPSADKLTDLSGQGNNGDAVNVQWTADGHRGGALTLSPNDSHIRVSNNDSLNPPQFTLYAWIKTSRADHYWRRIFDKGLFHNEFALSVAGDWTKWNPPAKFRGFIDFETLKSVATKSRRSVADGQWHQIVATYDGQDKRLFVDGQLQGTTHCPDISLGNNLDLVIGGFTDPDPQNDDPHASFDGSLDEVMMFNRALSPEEVQSLYHSQN